MIEKFKAFVDGIKEVILFIVLPIVAVILYIMHLMSKITGLQESLEKAKQDEKIKEDMKDEKQETIDANESRSDYESLRKQYLVEHTDQGPIVMHTDNKGGGQSPIGQGHPGQFTLENSNGPGKAEQGPNKTERGEK